MTEPLICPSCDAANPPASRWCSLCFAPFGAAADDADDASSMAAAQQMLDAVADRAPRTAQAADPEVPEPPPTTEQLQLIDESETGAKTWTCRFCDAAVPVGATSCPVCHQSIYDSFGARDDDLVDVPTGVALQWAAIPGGGHFRVGQGVLGLAIGLLVVVALVAGFFMLTGGRASFGILLVFVGFVTWLTSAHDAYRIADGSPDEVLLRPRVVSFIAGAVFILIVGAAVSARSAIPR